MHIIGVSKCLFDTTMSVLVADHMARHVSGGIAVLDHAGTVSSVQPCGDLNAKCGTKPRTHMQVQILHHESVSYALLLLLTNLHVNSVAPWY